MFIFQRKAQLSTLLEPANRYQIQYRHGPNLDALRPRLDLRPKCLCGANSASVSSSKTGDQFSDNIEYAVCIKN
jgi:hypothetical protein